MSIETFVLFIIVAFPVGMYIGITTAKKKKEPEKSQRDKDIEELLDSVGKLMEDERKKK